MKAIAEAGAAPRFRDARAGAARRPQITGGGLRRAALHEISILALALALLNTFLLVRWGIDNKVLAFDFRGTLWDAAIAVREGRSPYPAPVVDEVRVGNPAVYPPLLMLLVAPLTFLPWAVGATLWTVALCAGLAISRISGSCCRCAPSRCASNCSAILTAALSRKSSSDDPVSCTTISRMTPGLLGMGGTFRSCVDDPER